MVETSWEYWWPFVRFFLTIFCVIIAFYIILYLAIFLMLFAIMYKHGVDLHEAAKIEKEWWRRHPWLAAKLGIEEEE